MTAWLKAAPLLFCLALGGLVAEPTLVAAKESTAAKPSAAAKPAASSPKGSLLGPRTASDEPIEITADTLEDRKSTRLNSSHVSESRMPSSA